jgi:hypothetical protein
MHLDVDETNGGTNGPETISVSNIPDGVTAMYYIYDYSQNVGMGSMSFSDSDALSTIYGPNGSGHISVALNDDKIDGGETYFIIGCFDNNGYTGFHYVGETRADSELYCPDIAWSYTTGAPLTDAPLLVYGCANPQWEGDGYCDDTNNNDVCNYDGGDCCGDNVNMNYCSACQCLDPDYTHHPTEATVVCENPQFIGDGYCDDHLNIHDCTYDGGDCCGPAVQTNYCSDCQCLDFNYVNYDTTAAPVSACGYPSWVGDMTCDDANNNAECGYDGGDCCGEHNTYTYCSICQCLDPQWMP